MKDGGPVLFARAGALGDFVLTLPRLERLFASGRRVDVACARRHRPLVRLVGEPERFYDIDGVAALWLFGDGVDPVGYDEVLCFSEAMTPPVRTITRMAARPPGMSAAEHFGGTIAVRGRGEHASGPVVIAPGAGAPGKRWARWAEVGALVAGHVGGHPADVLFVGGPLEPEIAFRPDLVELIALARSARVWLGADSGPSHLAAFLGCPTGVVYTVTDPAVWAPPGAKVFGGGVDPGEIAAWVAGNNPLRRVDEDRSSEP